MSEKWFFPTEVHLRMRDQSLLKFQAGPQDVPSDLPEAEKEILKRHGAKPIEASSKPSASATKTPATPSVKPADTSDKAKAPEAK